MAAVAQLVEPRIVIPVVVGSSPIRRPKQNTQNARKIRAKQKADTFDVSAFCFAWAPQAPDIGGLAEFSGGN